MAQAGDSAIEIVFVLQEHSLLLDWAGPAEAFRIANAQAPKIGQAPPFRLRFVAPRPAVRSSVGASIADLEPLPSSLQAPCWVVLVGMTTDAARDAARDADERAVVHWLQRERPGLGGVRLVTVCAGALLAARAGLLAGRTVTTHHHHLDELIAAAPAAHVLANRVFVDDGTVWSSAGVTTGIDLALHGVRQVAGPVLAARVAQTLAVALRRGAGDPELSPYLAHRSHLHARLHRLQDTLAEQPGLGWTLQRMAAVAHASPRQLTRLFAEHCGTTPMAHLRGLRLAAAELSLAAGSTVTQAAEQAGFSSDLQLRRAWKAACRPGTPRRHAARTE